MGLMWPCMAMQKWGEMDLAALKKMGTWCGVERERH